MDIKLIYSPDTVEVFKRAKRFCDEEGLTLIEPIFLVREILQEGDCEFYEFLQEEEVLDDVTIDDVLEECIGKIVDKAKKRKQQDDGGKELTVDYGDDKSDKFLLSESLARIINWMEEQTQVYSGEDVKDNQNEFSDLEGIVLLVTPNTIMSYILSVMPNDVAKFLRRLGLMVSEVQEYFLEIEPDQEEDFEEGDFFEIPSSKEKSEETKSFGIPDEMENFLVDLTTETDGKKLILGRDKETKQIWSIISKQNKRNAILVGEPGVGKTAIVEKLVQDIKSKECPKKFKDYKILSLDVTGIIAGTHFRGDAEIRFQLLKKFLENNEQIILFIDEIHTILGAGACGNGEMDLANSLKPILARGKAIVIGATTSQEYEQIFSRDGALKRRFEKVEVNEPKIEEIYPMLKNKIKDLEKYHGVHVERKMVDFIVFTASCFHAETKNPDRTLDLIDRSMVTAANAGKANVDKDSVLANFGLNFERFNKMSLTEKKATAYHEAGHFVVHEMSGRLKNHSTIAISIMPAEYYLGINVYEDTDETVSPTMEYYIDLLAADLAGRVAERMISSEDNAGVAGDLEMATKTAYKVITKFGLVDDYTMAYLRENNVNLLSERVINRINKSIENLLKQAETRAREILLQNKQLLDAVANELLKHNMLSKKDLTRIIQEVNSSMNK